MIVFEGQAFNEKLVTRIVPTKAPYGDVYLYLNSYSPRGEQERIQWTFPNSKIAITKIMELTSLINEHEKEFLKLAAS